MRAAQRYLQTLDEWGYSIQGKRVFGYGGNFALGMHLLRSGASHVVLTDKFAMPDHACNYVLLTEFGQYLKEENGKVNPNPRYVTLISGDLPSKEFETVDFVFSNSVFGHVASNEIGGVTENLVNLMQPNGLQIHFIDLRDHFFKYPFQMLTFTEKTWRLWLNPTSNLNRLRFREYVSNFENTFTQVECTVMERNEEEFARLRSKIRPEFLTGDDLVDSVTVLRIIASAPRLQ